MDTVVVEVGERGVETLAAKIGRTRNSNMFWSFVLFVFVVTLGATYFILYVEKWTPLMELLRYSASADTVNNELRLIWSNEAGEKGSMAVLLASGWGVPACRKTRDNALVVFWIDPATKRKTFARNGNGIITWSDAGTAAARQQCEYMLRSDRMEPVSCGEEMYSLTGRSGVSSKHACQRVDYQGII